MGVWGALPPRPCISAFPEMKSYRKLCPQMVNFKNLSVAYRAARWVNVAGFEFDMGYNLLQLEAALRE